MFKHAVFKQLHAAVKADSASSAAESADAEDLSAVTDVSLVRVVRAGLLAAKAVENTAEFFKALSDPTRILIVNALQCHEWLCVSDLAAILGMSRSAISHQLSYLRLNKLVRVKREGKRVFYALDDDHVKQVFAMAVSHIAERDER